jgi:translocation and assembly module TamB
VRLTTPGIELPRLSASFERGGRDAPLRLRAEATSGEGLLGVDGELRSLQPRLAGELTVRGDNVLGVNRPEIRAWLSPDLKLALDGRDARLSGTLGVPRADITPSRLERGGVGPSADQVIVEARDAPPPEGRGVRVTSEVRIVLGEQVRFDGLGLKTRLAGAITAMDDPARPTRGRGELRLEGGRYKAYGQDLQIETGRLLFAGGPVTDPAIDLTAYRKPREDIKVGLKARGPLAAPEFSLFSEPAMSQEEQLSWLVLGRSLSATLDAGQRTELSSAAVSLGLTGGEYLAQQLAPRLGLDEVTLGARPGEAAELARLTIGKYLSPKLFVSYGYGLFEPGHFFRLQYDLAKRVKLVGESGVQQGGDVLYTIER